MQNFSNVNFDFKNLYFYLFSSQELYVVVVVLVQPTTSAAYNLKPVETSCCFHFKAHLFAVKMAPDFKKKTCGLIYHFQLQIAA